MNLAIKGHLTRGKEVIEILEMLGGINLKKLEGTDHNYYYSIDNDGTILGIISAYNHVCYTIEEFLKKFPYKIGGRVRVPEYESEVRISKMYWDGREVQYEVVTDEVEWYSAEELNEFNEPYKEETIEEEGVYRGNEINCYHQDFGDKVRIRLGGDYEIKVEGKITYIVKKQPQYPKTYEECCEVLSLGKDGRLWTKGYKASLIQDFQKLLICRDAYWKIAGEQMRLGKPWHPDWNNDEWPDMYYIGFDGRYIEKETGYPCCNMILIFSTEEMRDAFYENFKELINGTKELL